MEQQTSQEQDVKGVHWGSYAFDDTSLNIESMAKKRLIKVPLNKIVNSQVINKNEVVLEFPFEDYKDGDDMICEMRFFVPGTAVTDKAADKDGEGGGGDTKRADVLNAEIIAKAKIGEFAGDSIVTFQEINLQVPRGKYTIDFYRTMMRFHGASFDHKIAFKSINRAFLVPLPDDNHMVFVIGMEKPIRQGQTEYPFVVIQIKKDIEESIKINLKPDQIKEYYGEALKEEYEGALHDIMTKIFRAMVGVNIIIPGDFKTSTGKSGFRCSVRAREGLLFPLQKSFLFITKPVLYVKHDELARAEFQRVNFYDNQNKLFDLVLILKNGTQHQFVGIDKNELELLRGYFLQRKIPTKEVSDQPAQFYQDESDDEDDGPGQSSTKKKGAKRKPDEDSEDEEEESEDEDFVAPDDDGGSDDDDEDADFEMDEGKGSKDK